MKTYSEQLKEVISFFYNCDKEYQWDTQLLQYTDNLTQDYLHELELGGLNYDERAKVATKLSKCRKDRRTHKDKVSELFPISKFFNENKNIIHTLETVLGEVRKEEKAHKNRHYIPRTTEVK